jgi:N-acetyl sugar amidotransferase
VEKEIIKYCKICLNHTGLFKKKNLEKIRSKPDQLKDGICTVCRYEILKKKNKINWNKREKILNKITLWAKKNRVSDYDCIIPVSGGKDSLLQAIHVRDVLKLKPLLVTCSYPPEQITHLGARNYSNIVNNGFDSLAVTLDPLKWKKLMKHSFLKFGNWCRSTEMALYAIPIHIALFYQIKILFYGENFLYTVAHGTKDEGDSWDAKNLYLGGNTTKGGPKSLKYSKASELDYLFYNYPPKKQVRNANMKIVYLGWFMKNWYGLSNAKFSIKHGMEKRKKNDPLKTGDLWGHSALDEDFSIVNQHMKYLKKGYGAITDQVCEGIHQGIITRKDGIKLLEKYDGKVSEFYVNKFCKYLEISKKTYNETVDKFVNKDLFEKNKGKWVKKFKIL